MLMLSKLTLLGAAGLLLAVLPASAQTAKKPLPNATEQTAVIDNSGSTNTLGYKIIVTSDEIGHVPSLISSHASFDYKITMTSSGRTSSFSTLSGHGTSPTGKQITTKAKAAGTLQPYGMPELEEAAEKLFQDLSAAMPLNRLPVRHGMRSVSFGTQTMITYKGQTSPDLTFAADPRTAALKADVDTITKMLHIGNTPKRPIVTIRRLPSGNH